MAKHNRQGYRFLEHVTDAFVESWGKTFEDALTQAGLGLLDTMIDVKEVRPILREEIQVTGHDELELVYNWLEELLLAFELRRTVFGGFSVNPIRHTNRLHLLRAIGRGELYNPARHGSKVEVKGVTYHMMSVKRDDGLVKIQYILDL